MDDGLIRFEQDGARTHINPSDHMVVLTNYIVSHGKWLSLAAGQARWDVAQPHISTTPSECDFRRCTQDKKRGNDAIPAHSRAISDMYCM